MRKTLIALAIAAAPRAVFACPVCFGQSDSPMAWAANMGIFVMLGVVGCVLAAFASFFIYLARRARLFEDAELARAPDAARYRGTEGTAQC